MSATAAVPVTVLPTVPKLIVLSGRAALSFTYRLYAASTPVSSFTIVERQPLNAVGLTQASSVMPVVKSSEFASGIVTMLDVPLNVSALPYLPDAVHTVFATVPLLPLPDASATVVPSPSSKAYAATRPTGGGAVFDTVTTTGEDVVVLPLASRALAVSVCDPFDVAVVIHEKLYGALVSSAPTCVPSRRNATLATATLSDAFMETVTGPETVAPAAGAVIDTVGGTVSGVLATVTTTLGAKPKLPAASRAFADSVCEPSTTAVVFHETEYGDEGSSAPSGAPSRRNCTPTTPTLSAAVAVTVVVPMTVAPAEGAVTLAVGTVVSGSGPPPTAVFMSAWISPGASARL